MNDPFSALRHRIDALAARIRAAPHAEWGVITQASPLRVRLDGDAEPLLGTPSTLVSGLRVGDRVQAMIQNRKVTILGRGGGDPIRENKILWSGAWYMHGTQTAYLSELVSEQQTGIALIWSEYKDGEPKDYGWHTQFISKALVAEFPGLGSYAYMSMIDARKYVYISDNRIVGHAANSQSPNSGIVLRKVVGL